MGRSVTIDYTQEPPEPRADEILWSRLSLLDGMYFGYYFVSDEDFTRSKNEKLRLRKENRANKLKSRFAH